MVEKKKRMRERVVALSDEMKSERRRLKRQGIKLGDGRKRARKGKRTEVNKQGTRRGQPEEPRQVGIFSLFFLVHGAINKFNSSGN